MGSVVFDMTMSLDGFITGANDRHGQPLGEGGERLHTWIAGASESAGDGQVLAELFESFGAVVAGRRTYDVSEGPNGWGDGPLGTVPVFVVTHEAPQRPAGDRTVFTFVTDGIESALKQAKDVAAGKDVYLMGGANLAQQCIEAGLVDEIQLHIVPVLLGAGRPLFDHIEAGHLELAVSRVISTPHATHVRYRLRRDTSQTGFMAHH